MVYIYSLTLTHQTFTLAFLYHKLLYYYYTFIKLILTNTNTNILSFYKIITAPTYKLNAPFRNYTLNSSHSFLYPPLSLSVSFPSLSITSSKFYFSSHPTPHSITIFHLSSLLISNFQNHPFTFSHSSTKCFTLSSPIPQNRHFYSLSSFQLASSMLPHLSLTSALTSPPRLSFTKHSLNI